jgi:hypothetical protein
MTHIHLYSSPTTNTYAILELRINNCLRAGFGAKTDDKEDNFKTGEMLNNTGIRLSGLKLLLKMVKIIGINSEHWITNQVQ